MICAPISACHWLINPPCRAKLGHGVAIPIFEGLFKNATGAAWCSGRKFCCSAAACARLRDPASKLARPPRRAHVVLKHNRVYGL